jgi:hypothetical protein
VHIYYCEEEEGIVYSYEEVSEVAADHELSLVGMKLPEELEAREPGRRGPAGHAPNPRASRPETATGRLIRANAERNKWFYEQFVNHPEKTLGAIRDEAKRKGWSLSSDQALHQAVKSHCDSLGIPMPTRKKSRIKQD